MKTDKRLLSGSPSLLVLSLLRSGDKYGYEIISLLEAASNEVFQMKEGTLYPILHHLEKKGFVRVYTMEAPGGRTRRCYQLTGKGLRQLTAERRQRTFFSGNRNAILLCAVGG